MKFLVKVVICSFLLIGCKEKKAASTLKKKPKQSVKIKYAKGFDIQYFNKSKN